MRRVLLTILALFLAVLLGALWYASEKGFTRKWRNFVSEEFRKRGVEVTLRQLTLDPLRGLVARDVQVFDARDRRRTLAVIDEMALQVNFANLARGKTFLDALELREASLSLPLDPAKPGGAKLEVTRLNARLFLPPQQVYLAHADAVIFGLKISAAGRLIHPQAFSPNAGSDERFAPELIARILEELRALKFEGEPPTLHVTFSGDLAMPDQIVVDAALRGERLRRKDYALRRLEVEASFRAGVLDLKQLHAVDEFGELRLSGLWEPVARTARLQLRSSLDAVALAQGFGEFPLLSELVLYGAPQLEVQVEFGLGPAFTCRVLGRVALEKFAWRSVIFERAAAQFSSAGASWSVREIQLVRSAAETLTGDALLVPGDFRARLQSSINPKAFRPMLSGIPAETLGQFEFTQPPRITLEARGPQAALDGLKVDGEIALGAGSFRNVPADAATGKIHYENRVLSIAPFHLTRPEGGGDGGLHFDFRRDEVRLDKIRAHVHPLEVAMWIDPRLVKDLLPYRFPNQPPNLLIDGLVHIKRGKTTRLAVQVDAPAGMDYTFLRKNLSARSARAKLLFTSEQLKISELSAALFGGSLKGGAEISLQPARPGHRASLTLENVDFASVTKLYFDYDDSQGRLNGRFDFTARGSDARTIDGRGELAVTEGNIFAIPFLGPLSGVLDSIVPGMGHTVARHATTEFTMSNGAIATDRLLVQGTGFNMIGNGKLFFLDDRMDFDMRINAQGLPGVLLFPVSKLFEYTADQKLSKPVWRMKIVPRL